MNAIKQILHKMHINPESSTKVPYTQASPHRNLPIATMLKFRMKHLSEVPHEISCTMLHNKKTSQVQHRTVSIQKSMQTWSHTPRPHSAESDFEDDVGVHHSTCIMHIDILMCISTKHIPQIRTPWKLLVHLETPILFCPLHTDLWRSPSCSASRLQPLPAFWNLTLKWM